MKYNYIINNIIVGHIDYSPRDNQIIFINRVVIHRWYRGNNYSTDMFNKFINSIEYIKIQLLAMEDMKRYNKLYKLYESWGFIKSGDDAFCYDNRGYFRKSLFELTIPNIA